MPRIPGLPAAATANPLAPQPTRTTTLMAASMLGESAARRSPLGREPGVANWHNQTQSPHKGHALMERAVSPADQALRKYQDSRLLGLRQTRYSWWTHARELLTSSSHVVIAG